MKQIKRDESPVFTVVDHLNVQEQIEQRAYELWLAGGSPQTALDNWLHAECEVLEEFIRAYKNGHDDKPHQKWVGRSSPRSCVRSDARRIK